MSGIPFVIGVTGHRDLRSENIPVLTQLVSDQLANWKKLCPHTEFYCMTSLAEGADQLCGRIASDLGMRLLVPLPMEQAEYEKDFSGIVLDEFRSLLQNATSVFVAPDIEALHGDTREYAYRKAGIYLARHCHVLLALWDGMEGESGYCGTAETVEFKTKKTYRTPDSLLNTPTEGIVLHIVTPRASGNALPQAALFARMLERKQGALHELLKKTEEFNRDTAGADAATSDGVFEEKAILSLGQAAQSLEKLYRLSDALAMRFRNHYLALLKWLCATGALLVASFLFYDEFEANLFLIAYGVIALCAFILFLFAKHGSCHKKYIEYRLFAETLRVQLNLLAAGIAVNAEELMPWSQRSICPWIGAAMSALPLNGEDALDAHADVRAIWLQAQLNYQQSTLEKTSAMQKRQSKISGALLIFTILFFVVVVVLEFGFPVWIAQEIALPDWLHRLALMHSEHFFSLRGVFKILLGIIPAFAFVVSSYYGKLSLARKRKDGKRMIALYTEALAVYDNPRTDKARLFSELAREELAETGDWLSYVSENQLDIRM